MYTQCPECLTIYEIDEDALQASLGIVHCGRCDKRFDALRTLSDSLPEAPLTPLPEHDPATRTPLLTAAVPPAAYEAAAHRQRSRRGAAAGNGQFGFDLAPTSPADSPDVGEPQPERTAEDWFAQLESELADPTEATVEPLPVAAGDPALPAIDASVAPDDDDGSWRELEASVGDGSAPADSAAGPAQEPIAANAVDDDTPSVATDAPSMAGAMSASVVSPRLLEGDVFGDDTTVPNDRDTVAVEAPGVAVADASTVALPAGAMPDEPDAGAPPDVTLPEPELPAAEPDAASASTPIYLRPRRHTLSVNGLAWSAGCLLLALVLAVQLAWANRIELVRDPSTRTWAQRVCAGIPCRLPPIKDVVQLELLSRDVRPDPNAQGALTITATVRNNASFRQPWPIVTVELTDFDNHPVAMRRFRPAEYMPDPARRAAGIAPGATAAVAFEVADPGKRAGGYRFSFE